MLSLVLRGLLTPIWILFALALALSALRTLHGSWDGSLEDLRPAFWMSLGFTLRLCLALLCRRMDWNNPMAFIDTLEHELSHAIAGYLTFNPPLSLKADAGGEGEVMLKGQNPFTLLAPYFFPLFAWPIAAVTLFLDPHIRPYGEGLALILLGSFSFRSMAEYRWRQSDLHAYGFFFSTSLAALLWIVNVMAMLSVLKVVSWEWLQTFLPTLRELAQSLGVLAKRSWEALQAYTAKP